MRHFVAYHNVERMGRPLHEGNPFQVLTSKSVERLLQNTVWFIVGEGKGRKRYLLGSVFVVSEVGDSAEQAFKHFARGQGHVFQPLVPLNELEWFPDFRKSLANFSLGVRELTEARFIGALEGLASQAGYHGT